MTAPATLSLDAEVDAQERAALVAGAQQLAEALKAATGADWPLQLRFCSAGEAAADDDAIVILSLMPEIECEEPLAAIEARWRSRAGALVEAGAQVLILTIFRHLPERHTPAGQQRLERIRELNRLAPSLSHDLGVTVVDIDRAFAHIGARVLATDWRLQGRLAAEVGGHCLALALLQLGLDDVIPVDVQTRALAFHGLLREINVTVNRRLSAA